MIFREIPLNKLKLSPLNMRQGDVDTSDLVASFTGIKKFLQNLRVTEEKTEAGKPTGFYLVHVGGRRLRAANIMADKKVWKKTHPVPCTICENEAEALEESVAENFQRLDPSPAERFKAFKALADQGQSPAEIADRFGLSELIVRRRLKLAVVSPRLFELFESGEISIEQMQAFTVSDDHAAQEAAWFDAPSHGRWAHDIKRALTKGEVSSSDDPVAAFVGLDAYAAAGGSVRQDLFAHVDGSGYLNDVGLLERLAYAKLEEAAEPIRAEGWKWVETRLRLEYDFSQTHGRVYPVAPKVALTEEQQALLEDLTAELEAACEGDDYDAQDDLQKQIDALCSGDGEAAFTDDQKALAGVIVTIARDGVRIERGYVKPGADTKALKTLQRAADQAGEGGDALGAVAANAPKTRADGLSAALVENLTAHRTLALRATLMDNPRVAMVATVHQLVTLAFYKQPYGATPLTAVVVTGDPQLNVMGHGDDLAQGIAAQAISARREALAASLPTDHAGLWSYLAGLSDEGLASLLAFAVSQQVYAVNQGTTYSRERVLASDDLARDLGLKMADYWAPDAAFFARIPKAEILTAMKEGADVGLSPELDKMKKGDLAARAAQVLDGKGWVPDVIRTPPRVKLDAGDNIAAAA